MYDINFHHQVLARMCSTNSFEHEKIFQILGTERNIKSFTFIFLGFCLIFKLTFTIKKFMNNFWNDFKRTCHDGCFC